LYIGPGQGVQTFTLLLQNNDSDFDGYPDGADCAPFDPYIHPGALELCNGIDNNCDGLILTPPSISMYFVPDSLVTEPNGIFIVCQTTNVTSWSWNFGNGESSNLPYPTVNYISPGTYNVCLGGSSLDGCVVDSCLTFTIDTLGFWSPGSVVTDYTLHIVPEYIVGVEETMTNNVKVWPNPVSGMINVTTPSNSGNIKVMSIDGRCVYQNKYTTTLSTIDSEILGQGTYVILINDDSGRLYTTKIVK
jgi:hypothetical protein